MVVVPGARQSIVGIKSKGRISDLQLSKRKEISMKLLGLG